MQVYFDDLNGDREQYFLIQKLFSEGFAQRILVESHDYDEVEYCYPKIKLGRSRCTFEFDGRQFIINYQIEEAKFKELEGFLKILGSLELTD